MKNNTLVSIVHSKRNQNGTSAASNIFLKLVFAFALICMTVARPPFTAARKLEQREHTLAIVIDHDV
jgi:hypothetical protein